MGKLKFDSEGDMIISEKQKKEYIKILGPKLGEVNKVLKESKLNKEAGDLALSFLFMEYLEGNVNSDNIISKLRGDILKAAMYLENGEGRSCTN